MLAEALPPGGASAPDGAPRVEAAAAPARPAATAAAAPGADGGPFDDGRPLSVGGDEGGLGDVVLVLLLALIGPVAPGGDGLGAVDAPAGGSVEPGAAAVGALAGLGPGVLVRALVAEAFVGTVAAGRLFAAAPSAVGGADGLGALDAPAGGDEAADAAAVGARAGLGGEVVLVLVLALDDAEEFVGVVAAGRGFGVPPSAVLVACAAPGGDALDDDDAPVGGGADMLLGGPAELGGDAVLVPSFVDMEEFVGVVVAGRSLGAASFAAAVACAAPGDVLGDVLVGGDEGADAANKLLGGPADMDDGLVSCPEIREGVAGAGAACAVLGPGDGGVDVGKSCSDDCGAGVGDATSAARGAVDRGSTIGRMVARRCTSFRS